MARIFNKKIINQTVNPFVLPFGRRLLSNYDHTYISIHISADKFTVTRDGNSGQLLASAQSQDCTNKGVHSTDNHWLR